MNPQSVPPRVWVLSILISLLAFCTGHLWRHAELQTALASTAACLVAVLTGAALAKGTQRRAPTDDE